MGLCFDWTIETNMANFHWLTEFRNLGTVAYPLPHINQPVSDFRKSLRLRESVHTYSVQYGNTFRTKKATCLTDEYEVRDVDNPDSNAITWLIQ